MVQKRFLIAQNKRSDALNAMQKNPSSLQSMVSDKVNKNLEKIAILCHFG